MLSPKEFSLSCVVFNGSGHLPPKLILWAGRNVYCCFCESATRIESHFFVYSLKPKAIQELIRLTSLKLAKQLTCPNPHCAREFVLDKSGFVGQFRRRVHKFLDYNWLKSCVPSSE